MSSSESSPSSCSTAAEHISNLTLSDADVLDNLPAVAKKRACDQCYRRKTRCIGTPRHACESCSNNKLDCTFEKPLLKRGPRGKKGRIIDELRHARTNRTIRCEYPSVPPVPSCSTLPSTSAVPSSSPLTTASSSAPSIDTLLRAHCVLSLLYPSPRTLVQLDVSRVLSAENGGDEGFRLSLALAAYTLITTKAPVEVTAPRSRSRQLLCARQLMQVAWRLNHDEKDPDNTLSPESVEVSVTASIATSLVLLHCCLGLGDRDTAWSHLQEAKAVLLDAGLHEEGHYNALRPLVADEQRSIFWLVFVLERTRAIQRQCPPALFASIQLPENDSDNSIRTSLFRCARLFLPFGGTWSLVWTPAEMPFSTQWLVNLEQQLKDDTTKSHEDESENTWTFDAQCSRHWLRVILWQVALRYELLSSNATYSVFSFHYPVQVAHDLLVTAERLNTTSMDNHSVNLTEKIFDIACAVVDVMKCVPVAPLSPKHLPWDCLDSLTSLLGHLRGGPELYSPLLERRLSEAGLLVTTPNPAITPPSLWP